MTVPVALTVGGLIMIALAFVGGVAIKEIVIPKMPSWLRVCSFVLGAVLIGVGIQMSKAPAIMPSPTSTIVDAITPDTPIVTSIPPTNTPTSAAPTLTPTTTSALTATPADTATPTPVTSDLRVPVTDNKGVLFTAPADGDYLFTIKEGGVYCTKPDLCRSIIRGYVDRDIVWDDWYGKPHPMKYDYEIGCWEQDTAINRNCPVVSKKVPMKAQQYIRWVIMEDRDAFADNTGAVVLAVEKLP